MNGPSIDFYDSFSDIPYICYVSVLSIPWVYVKVEVPTPQSDSTLTRSRAELV